jgi:hypothetical protein
MPMYFMSGFCVFPENHFYEKYKTGALFYQVLVFLREVYFKRSKTFVIAGEGGINKISAVVELTGEYRIYLLWEKCFMDFVTFSNVIF